MGQVKRPFKDGAAKFKAAFYSVIQRHIKSKIKLPHLSIANLARHSSVNYILIGALCLNILGPALPALIAAYNAQQKHILPPLASDTKPASAPAADAAPVNGKAAQLTSSQQDQLTAERDQQQKGRPRDSRHVKLLEHKSDNQQVFLNADGTKGYEYSAQATGYKDSQGQWKDVDASLAQDTTTGKWHTKANAWQATFGDILNDGVQVNQAGQTFSFKPQGAQSVKPTITGTAPHQIITYRNVWQGVDIQYTVGGSELKETFVIKSRIAQSTFDFDLGGMNLVPDTDHQGAFKLTGALSDFTIVAPMVGTFDKGVIGGDSYVSQALVDNKLHIALDATWLKNQDVKAFPIALDPTLISRSSIQGNWYRNFRSDGLICDPGSGCGNSTGIASGQTWRFAYHVDMTNVTPSGYMVGANLHIEMPDPDGVHYWGTYGSQPITVEHASCLTSINCVDAGYGVATGSAAYSGEIDVSNIYRNAFAGNDLNAWMMVAGGEGGGETYKLFSVDRTTVTFNMDQLPSQPTIDAGAPADNGVAISTQPALKSIVPTDSDGPGPLQYRYIVGTTKNVPPSNPNNIIPSVTGVITDSGLTATPQWNVPDNVLQDGSTYYWQASVWDSYANSPQVYGPVYSFKVDLRNGKNSTQAFDAVGPASVDLATGNLTTGAKTHSIAALGGSLGVSLSYNSPQRSRPGLVAEYFNNPTQTTSLLPDGGTPAVRRVESNVDYNWANSTPYAGVISSDYFQARWTGYFIAPSTGTFTFGGNNDDRMAVYVNNQLLYDNGNCYTGVCMGSGISLTAGQIVPIKVLYNEYTSFAYAHLYVGGAVAQQVVPADWLQTGVRPIATPHGLVGHYYTDDGTHTFPTNTADPTRSFLTRTDTSLNLDWGSGSPVPGGPADNFLVRWTGYFTAPIADTYTFGAGADDGVRVIANGNTVVDAWTDHGPSPVVYAASGIALSQGQTIPVTIEYYEHTNGAKMGLYIKQASLASAPDTIVDSSWVTPQAQILPDGWSLADGSGAKLGYDFAVIAQNSVVLRDSTGQTHEYKWTGTGYTPPINEAGQMVRNGDGTITLQDTDGRTYVFNTDGTIKAVSMPLDDLHPAALQYVYSGTPTRLTQISDATTQSDPKNPLTATRWAKVLYQGDSGCPSVPSGFATVPTNMICAVSTSDSNVTQFAYTSDSTRSYLSRLIKPGSETSDYTYDTSGRIVSTRDSTAYDVVAALGRSDDATVRTEIAYDAIGRISSVTLPAANAGDTRMAHSYEYLPGSTKEHIANATESNGFSRKIVYDSTFRTSDDTDVANLTTHTDWDPAKDLALATTDPTGLKSTTLYDFADRATDQYGPAPSTWFGTDRKPLTSPTDYSAQVPHRQTSYDGSINGLAASYYNVATATNGTGASTRVLSGAPKLHGTGVGTSNGDIIKTWNATAPFTPDTGNGWGVSLTGDIHVTANGNYTFRAYSNDGVRVWIDDQLVVNDWNDGAQRSHIATPFNNTSSPADSWHRIRLDYYNQPGATNATLSLFMTPPGGAETSALGSLLTPLYGLTTSQTTYDTQIGNSTSTTNYGPNPELGLAQSSTVDPTNLSLTGTTSYETQGGTGSFLRQTSKSLPGSGTTSYTYYNGTETRQNPCNTSQTFKQAGMLKLKTEADPDGAGPQVGRSTETVYDDTGRVVANRYNTDAWTCSTYDNRGRVTQVTMPAFNGQAARTVTNTWVMYGDPLVIQSADGSGNIQTKSDLLGRISRYVDEGGNTTDYAYDNVGHLISKTSPLGTEAYVYDSYNHLTQQKLDGMIYASVSYDAFGRTSNVAYPTAGSLALAVSRDSLGRLTSSDYTLGNGTTHLADSVTRSQSGQVTSGTELGAAKSYTYDKAGRLTAATIGTHSYAYNFGTPTACTGTYNSNAGKNSDRTSQVIDGVTQTYCYDYADRLIQGSDPNVDIPAYDGHGNTINMGTSWNGKYTQFFYDSSDRNIGIRQNWGNDYDVAYNRDVQNRVMSRFETGLRTSSTWYGFTGPGDAPSFARDASWAIVEKYIQLPGNVLLTVRPTVTPAASQKVFALANVHGDVMATTDATGAQIATFQYDPFGNATTTPDNSVGGTSFGWTGQRQKDSEIDLALKPIQMGARVYIPTIGRFAQIDPIDGGVQNNYIYPPDPINANDYNGKSATGTLLTNIGTNADNMGGMLTVSLIGIGLLCVATEGLACAVAVAVLGGTADAGKAYNKYGNTGVALGFGAVSGTADYFLGAKGDELVAKGMPYVAHTVVAINPTITQRSLNSVLGPVRVRTQAATAIMISSGQSSAVDKILATPPANMSSNKSYKIAVNNLVKTLIGFSF